MGGAIIGGAASGNWRGAAIGAAAGAVAGGMAGFFHARLNKIEDREQRLAEYRKVLGESSQGWDLERASVEKAYDCYGKQINLLKSAVKAKKISKEEFLARMTEIKSGIENINTYWAGARTRMEETLADGEAFLKEEEKAQKTKAERKAYQRAAALRERTTKENLQKNKALDEKGTKLLASVDEMDTVLNEIMGG